MDQRRAAEVRLAHAVHYNHLEISSETFFLLRLNIMTYVFHGEDKTASVCWSASKYREMLNVETSRRRIKYDVTEI